MTAKKTTTTFDTTLGLLLNKMALTQAKLVPIEKKVLSKKAQSVLDIIDKSDFGCKKETVANLMSAVIGEKITVKEAVTKFHKGNLLKIKGTTRSGAGFSRDDFVMCVADSTNDVNVTPVVSKKAKGYTTYVYNNELIVPTKAEYDAVIKIMKSFKESEVTYLLKFVL